MLELNCSPHPNRHGTVTEQVQFRVLICIFVISTYLAFLHFILKTQGEQTNMSGLFPVNTTGFDRLS